MNKTTLPRFWCWRKSESREDGRLIEASSAADAAENYADRLHREEGEWSFQEIVKLVKIGHADVRTFQVDADAVPNYSASEIIFGT